MLVEIKKKVVNDIAERTVKLTEKHRNKLTNDNQNQFNIQRTKEQLIIINKWPLFLIVCVFFVI